MIDPQSGLGGWSIQQVTGSFAGAAGALAAFGAASLTMPVKSRLIDRYGQPRTLCVLGTGYAALLVGICVLAVLGVDHAMGYVILGGAAGVAAPPLGPSMRALWAGLSGSPVLRQRAYSLDSVVEESLYTLGPLLTGGLIALAGPVLALGVTAVLVLVGSVGLATSPAARQHAAPVTSRVPEPLLGPLRQPGFLSVLASILAIGVCLGAVDVGVAARAQHVSAASVAGYLLAALSLGSAVGGLAGGTRTHQHRRSTQLAALLSMLAVGVALAAWVPNLVVLGAVLALTGLALAPAYVVAYVAVDDLVPDTGRTAATTWINTANNIGSSAGAATAGPVVDQLGASTSLFVGAIVVILSVPIVLASRRSVDRHPLE